MNSSRRPVGILTVRLAAVSYTHLVFKLVSGKEEAPQYETRPTVAVQTPVTGDITLYTELTAVSYTHLTAFARGCSLLASRA